MAYVQWFNNVVFYRLSLVLLLCLHCRINEDQTNADYAGAVASSPTEVAVDYFRSLHPGHYSSTLAMNGGLVTTDTTGLLLGNGSSGKTRSSITTTRTGGDVTTNVGSLCDVIDHASSSSSSHADSGLVPEVAAPAGTRLMSTTHDEYYRCAPPYGKLPDVDSERQSATMATNVGGERWTAARIDFAPYRDHLSNAMIPS